MKIRKVQPKDLSKLEYLYKIQGFDYPLPTTDEFMEDEVLVNDNDEPVVRIAALNMVELYLFIDPDFETPGMKFELFKLLHEHMRVKLANRGVAGAHVFLPPQVEKSFSRRLTKQLGWVKSTWTCLFRRI